MALYSKPGDLSFESFELPKLNHKNVIEPIGPTMALVTCHSHRSIVICLIMAENVPKLHIQMLIKLHLSEVNIAGKQMKQ